MLDIDINNEDDAAVFWQTPTFTERDLSEARTDAWNRGYVAGFHDSQPYKPASTTTGIVAGMFFGSALTVLGYIIASVMF